MRYPAHLRRNKSGLLHLRLTVPNDLRPVLARREIKRSLNIRDTALAHRWALALTTRFGIHFEEFWFMVRRGYDPKNFDPTNPATWPTREGVVGEYKMRFNAHTGEIDIESDPNVPGDHKNAMEAMRETVKEAKALYESPVLLDQMKLAQQKREAEEQMFMALTDPKVRALPDEVAMRVAEAMQPKSALTVPATLKAAASQYRASLVGMDERTINDYMFAVDWFVRGLGEDLQVSAIDEVRVNAWKSEVLDHYTGIREKKQAKKVTQGHLTVDPVAGLPQVAPKPGSVDKIISRAHKFMMYCQKLRFYPRGEDLPTANKTLLSHAERKKLSFYEKFDLKELEAIFAKENLLRQTKPHEFWMPLLCLFTGARIGELSQIYHSDIQQDGLGCHVISIRDKDGFQRLKTNAACRIVPIHPTLIELGFLDYVQDAKDAAPNSQRIFPYLRHDKSNGFGDVPSEAFARYLDGLGIHDEAKTAHSFRKTANQRLKDNDVATSIRCQLVGHEREGINETVYATDISTQKMFEILRDRLVFPEIDFTTLKYAKGRFVEIIKSEMVAAVARKRIKLVLPECSESSLNATPEKGDLAVVASSAGVVKQGGVSEKMKNHLEARAARDARTMPKRRGRPPKAKPFG